ncbi:MAG: tRNA (adenosine(37)-N6)-threonylcarbamoyltransferase complex dimerization subunit type 1 TsaB [Bacteroidia bacterium]|nr:tRNA (adenosine(37)-N6)-threonylcarbamoyltransferase complex dimerization subunit type 1 TsaB [Bacteroidia bacterium]
MAILCIESSGNICSAALALEGGKVITSIVSTTGEHASLLTTAISNVMTEAGVEYKALDAVAVSAGPGSYTGLRIGASTAKGICYANDIPLIAIPTLEIIAEEIFSKSNAEYAIPMIDARRMEVYCATIDRNFQYLTETEAKILDDTAFAETLSEHKAALGGSGAEKSKTVITSANATFIDDANAKAEYMTKLAEKRYAAKDFADVAYFEPFYLKEYVAVVSKNKVLEEARKNQ